MKLEEMSAEELVSYRDDCREFMGPNGRGFVFTEKLEHTCDVCNGDGFI